MDLARAITSAEEADVDAILAGLGDLNTPELVEAAAQAFEEQWAEYQLARIEEFEKEWANKDYSDPNQAELRDLAMQELHLTSRQQSQLWDHVKQISNFWTTLPELEPGIISRIAKTAADRRWEVIFLTTRPSTAAPVTPWAASGPMSDRTATAVHPTALFGESFQ